MKLLISRLDTKFFKRCVAGTLAKTIYGDMRACSAGAYTSYRISNCKAKIIVAVDAYWEPCSLPDLLYKVGNVLRSCIAHSIGYVQPVRTCLCYLLEHLKQELPVRSCCILC